MSRHTVVISGSRSLEADYKVVKRILDRYLSDGIIDTESLVLHGGCREGVDRHVKRWTKRRSLDVEEVPADWDTHGRSAGPIRNRQMVQRSDTLVAIWDGQSAGTKSTILAAVDKGINIHVEIVEVD